MAMTLVTMVAFGMMGGVTAGTRAADELQATMSESLRRETWTRREETPSSIQTTSGEITRSTLTLTSEMPLRTVGKIDKSTLFSIKVGSFLLKGYLGADASYVPGASSARLLDTEVRSSNGVRRVKAKAELKWSAHRLKVKLTSSMADPIATAFEFIEEPVGDFEGVAPMRMTFGNQTMETDVFLNGTATRQSTGLGTHSSTDVVTIEIKGSSKLP